MTNMAEKKILDVTCGDRTIWFQKNHSGTIYCDKRREEWEGVFGAMQKRRHLVIDPDVQCDFTDLPFEDESFSLVVFDPPHIKNLTDSSWMKKAYGSLYDGWEQMIHDGFFECMRVLKTDGVLIFKWSDISISTREVINAIGKEPLFGHRSGKKMNTHWLCFMKEAEAALHKMEEGAVPAVHGRWVERAYGEWYCSQCGYEIEGLEYHPSVVDYNFCPKCGAKLDAEEKI